MNTWREYDVEKPDEAKVYEWKHTHKKGFEQTFHDVMRMRGNGYSPDILSPGFDHWDGVRVHVPSGMMWRDAADQELAKELAKKNIVGINNERLNPCPFCGTVPSITASQCGYPGGGDGIVILAKPKNYNTWRIVQCCSLIGFNGFASPFDLFDAWNGRKKKTVEAS